MSETIQKQLKGLAGLSEPFKIDEVKWVVSHSSSSGIFYVPYIEKYDVYTRLNECVGPENWSTSQEHLSGGYMKCEITVKDPITGSIVTRSGVGDGKGGDLKAADTDSVKRAGTGFGIGNFSLEVVWPTFDEVKKKDNMGREKFTKVPTWMGKRIYGNDINKHIRNLLGSYKVSPHEERTVWLNNNTPSGYQQSETTQPAPQPIKPESKSPFSPELAMKMIEAADSLAAYETAKTFVVKVSDSKVNTAWGEKITAWAQNQNKETILKVVEMVKQVFGDEDYYLDPLRRHYQQAS